jgi:hypothetical protein
MERHFGHDFSDVRVHSDGVSSWSAVELRAKAYTFGTHIVFAEGRYSPHTEEGRRLIAHELTHVVQQRGVPPWIQRSPDDDDRWKHDVKAARYRGQVVAERIRNHTKVSKEVREIIHRELAYFESAARDAYLKEVKPALLLVHETEMLREIEPPAVAPANPLAFWDRMRRDPAYLDNNIKWIRFYTAEQADIHYADGSMYRLGLVPKWMKSPIVDVDYHTPRQDLMPDVDRDGNLSFLSASDLKNVPGSMAWGEVQKQFARRVDFVAAEGHIVPSRINNLTAPKLCAALRESEAKFQQNVDLAVEFGMGTAKVLQLQMMNPLMGGGGPPGVGGTAVRTGTRTGTKLLGGAATESLTVVEIGAGDLKAAIEVAKQGGAKVIAVDPAVPAAAAVKELEGLGGQFVKGVAKDIAPGTADHVFQYFPWRITGTGGKWIHGGTMTLVEDTVKLLKPNGAAHFVTEEYATAEFLAAEASQQGLKAVITKTTAGAAAPGATGAGVQRFGSSLEVWMVNIYK